MMIRALTTFLITLLLATMVMGAELGKTKTALDGREARVAETTLGDFVVDAIRTEAGADIAIMHAQAFRDNALIDQGVAVTEQDIRNALFNATDTVVTLKMTPAQLRAMLQRAFTKLPDPNAAFLQISGMTVAVDAGKPAATRVQEVKIAGKAIDFTDTKTTYIVAMPQQLANGAVGYYVDFHKIADSMETKDATVLEAITRAFTKQPEGVNQKLDGRITITPAKEE